MEIFGSTFDDSVFLEARERVCESLSSYNAKVCDPQWFCENSCLHNEDSLEKQKVFKFRGDLAVRQGNYQKALEAYSSCLQLTSDNNLTIRRDVLEGMARCCTKLGQRNEALDLASSLSKEVSNTCHLTSLLLLKVSIYHHFGLVRPKMSCLQQLCTLLPFNPWYWFSLGQMCLQLLDSNTATEPVGGETEENQEELSEEQIWLQACVSLIRTRYRTFSRHEITRAYENNNSNCILVFITLKINVALFKRKIPSENKDQTNLSRRKQEMRYGFMSGSHLSQRCCHPQTPVEKSTAAAVLLCAAAQPKGPAGDRRGVTAVKSSRTNSPDPQ
uniref:Chromosome 8 open reading frame 76 n=1 Tax=Nothobranchius furzeri TaxID=105023 RepID=A0A8C6NKV6_NOTFU